MELTGAAKEAFEAWFKKTMPVKSQIYNWNMIPNSMKFGVFVDFFNSIGFYCSVRHFRDSFHYKIELKKPIGNHKGYSGFRDSINEARTKAIEKANELFNEKSK